MTITDNTKTVKISIRRWNGSNYGEDFAADYFEAAALPYDASTDAYIVPDVDYCIDMANSTDPEGARTMCDEYGDIVPDEAVTVFVEDVA